MKLKILILNFILNICKPFAYMQRIDENQITFISLESDVLEGNFERISQGLKKEYPMYHQVFHLVKFKKNLWGYFTYFLACIHQLFLINRSQMVILDFNNYIACNYKRKEVKVVQIWHASGCIKKFGNETDRDYRVKGYDYVLTASEAFKPYFAKAFGVKESQVIPTGIPITDDFFDEEKKLSAKLELEQSLGLLDLVYEKKKVILYAPTFRGRLMKGFKGEYLDVVSLSQKLGDDYIILYKMHPLMAEEADLGSAKNVINVSKENLTKLFAVTDILISDYSALIFDFSSYQKPIILYAPDMEEYSKETGLFLDYEKEMPGNIVKTEEDLLACLQAGQYNYEKIAAFKEKYATCTDGHSLERVVRFMDEVMRGTVNG